MFELDVLFNILEIVLYTALSLLIIYLIILLKSINKGLKDITKNVHDLISITGAVLVKTNDTIKEINIIFSEVKAAVIKTKTLAETGLKIYNVASGTATIIMAVNKWNYFKMIKTGIEFRNSMKMYYRKRFKRI